MESPVGRPGLTGVNSNSTGPDSPMVAVPRSASGNPGTLGARAPGIGPGGQLVKLEVKLHPRKRDQSQFVRWRSALSNAATLGGLSALLQNQRVPDAELVNQKFPDVPQEQQQATLQDAIAGYQAENTALFFIIEPSVMLDGHWELLDREWIQENYVSGDLRDGVGLLSWIEKMHDQTSEQGQVAGADVGGGPVPRAGGPGMGAADALRPLAAGTVAAAALTSGRWTPVAGGGPACMHTQGVNAEPPAASPSYSQYLFAGFVFIAPS